MNKFKTMKYKTTAGDAGLFDKLSKYSTVRFLRKPNGRKGSAAAAPPLSGSYDMTGRESDDHKLEIGAPILISKTSLDFDTIDAAQEPLNRSSDQSDEFLDANSSTANDSKSSYHSVEQSASDQSQPTDERVKSSTLESGETNKNTMLIASRSKSATNLHKAELSIFLDRNQPLENGLMINGTGARSVSNLHAKRAPSKLSVASSRDSIAIDSSIGGPDEDFDLKSASFQSLDARNIFLSIDELNDITQQINESDDFKPTDQKDLEYCAHRDNLRPSERRITLLRNKNHKLLNVNARKDKLTNAWSDFKVWIGEERGKIKEVVNKHAAVQRVAGNNQNCIQSAAEVNAKRIAETEANGRAQRRESDEAVDASALSRHGSRRAVGSEEHESNGDSLQSNASAVSKAKAAQDTATEVNRHEHFASELFSIRNEQREA